MVNNKRAEFGIIVNELTRKLTSKQDYRKIRTLKFGQPPFELFHYVNKKHEKLVPKLLQTLKVMKKEKIF